MQRPYDPDERHTLFLENTGDRVQGLMETPTRFRSNFRLQSGPHTLLEPTFLVSVFPVDIPFP